MLQGCLLRHSQQHPETTCLRVPVLNRGVKSLRVDLFLKEGQRDQASRVLLPSIKVLMFPFNNTHVHQSVLSLPVFNHHALVSNNSLPLSLQMMTLSLSCPSLNSQGIFALLSPLLPTLPKPSESNLVTYQSPLSCLSISYQQGQVLIQTPSVTTLATIKDSLQHQCNHNGTLVDFETDTVHLLPCLETGLSSLFKLYASPAQTYKDLSLLQGLSEISLMEGEETFSSVFKEYLPLLENQKGTEEKGKTLARDTAFLNSLVLDMYSSKCA